MALWATQRLLPLTPGGEFARGLMQGRAAAVELDHRLRADGRFVAVPAGSPELDIVVWQVGSQTRERGSELAQRLFEACAKRDLHLALVQLPEAWFGGESGQLVTCLRSVLMKPEHSAWLDAIWERLMEACAGLD